MGQDSGDDQWHNRHAANLVLALIVFFVFFYSPQGGSKLLLKRLTRRHRQARNLDGALDQQELSFSRSYLSRYPSYRTFKGERRFAHSRASAVW